jgi:two-component system LytT family sensor kinase
MEPARKRKVSVLQQSVVIAGILLFFAALGCLHVYIYNRTVGRPISLRDAASYPFTSTFIWILIVPIVLSFADWLKRARFGFARSMAAHTLFSLVVMLLDAIGWIPFAEAPNADLRGVPRPSLHFIQLAFWENLEWAFWMYWTIVGIAYGMDYYADVREARVRAAELEHQLARSELQVLKQQLQPHFLFNTLHSISALMHKNVGAADDMISDLSTLLRLSLENSGTHEVPLRDELQALQLYLNIQRVRFQDRLTVDINVDPNALEARVPHLVLQPLVENAFRHGISKRATGGVVRICAERRNGSLLLGVSDNGPGLSQDSAQKKGIGLENTRARLQKLYGERSSLRAGNSSQGFSVELELPFLNDSLG